MRSQHQFVTADEILIEAARAVRRAATACRRWEQGGLSDRVSDTAATALSMIESALIATQCEDGTVLSNKDPKTRRARFVLAGYLLLLAGTDEDGESADLSLAASIFRRAAIA